MNRLPVALAGAGALLAAVALAQPQSGPQPRPTAAQPGAQPTTSPHATSSGTSPHGAMPAPSPHSSMPGAPTTTGMPPHGAAHGTTAGGTSMGALTPSTATRQMVTCRIDQLGNVPVLVNFAERTALSTRAAGVNAATLEGDLVRWQEKESGGASKYTWNRKTGEILVAVPGPGGKDVTHRGTCAPTGPRR